MNVRAAQFTPGRSFGVVFDHGADFLPSLAQFCKENAIMQGYIPMFVGAFQSARVVGTCHRSNPELPMYDEYVEAEYVETVGAGTIAWDDETQAISPHIHLSIGKRMQGGDGITSHLFEARVQFTIELVVVEVAEPKWTRQINPDVHDIKLLTFD